MCFTGRYMKTGSRKLGNDQMGMSYLPINCPEICTCLLPYAET